MHHPTPSDAIKYHQSQSNTISRNQIPSVAIKYHQSQSSPRTTHEEEQVTLGMARPPRAAPF